MRVCLSHFADAHVFHTVCVIHFPLSPCGKPAGFFECSQDVFLVVGIESRVTGFGKQFADVTHLGTHHDFVVEEGEGDITRIQYIFPLDEYHV